MLQTIRDNSQGVIAKVIIGFIIGVFALFGAESIIGGFLGGNNVASVNGEEITEQELAQSLQSVMTQMGANVQDFDEELLREIALGQLIEDRLLMQAAQGTGMTISADSLDRQIVRTPQFQVGGRFDSEMARRTMAAQGMTPQTYRASLAQQMMMSQLANAYASSGFVTNQEIQRLAALELQSRDFRYLSVPLANRSLGEAIPAEDIRAYYDNNPAEFTAPEQVSVNYVVLDKNQIFNEVDVDETRVREQYEEERDAAVANIERRASHILWELGGDASEQELLTVAADVKARLDAGEDFGELAREFSDDVVSAEDDGDIGYTDGSVFPAALEQALLNLEVDQVSEPVVSEFGVHLVKLTEYDAQTYPEFEEVAERIERDLNSTEVDELYFSRLETLANLAFENFDLQGINDELGLEIQQSEFFGRSGGSTNITSDERVADAAFSDDVLMEELNSELIELSDTRAVVVHLREHRPESMIPFEEVRAEIAVTLRGQREREMAREVGEELLAALEAGDDISARLQSESLSWIEREDVRRNQADVNTEIVRNVFQMPAPEGAEPLRQGFSLNNGAYVLVELQAVEDGDAANMPEQQRQQLTAALIENQGRMSFDALLRNLQAEADISGLAMGANAP
ncbi:SurA N-terminal domain-containing protein [Pseudohongiella acticola]|mgnify:CR=1 FL=1|jgi:peptidyl-prolyl cis-trans isomerase D|uniref:SurA N-terminal domain-containing protein n=1 Tax=Pseudohongiella acticola TaxID=1524254 RepID=UPI0030EEB477